MIGQRIVGNILGHIPKADSKSKNKEYLGYDIKQKEVNYYKIYVIEKDGVELTDYNDGSPLYFQTYNQAKYYIEKNLR